MRDDEIGEDDDRSIRIGRRDHGESPSQALFGDYFVLGPGVQIVIEGRTVTNARL